MDTKRNAPRTYEQIRNDILAAPAANRDGSFSPDARMSDMELDAWRDGWNDCSDGNGCFPPEE